MTAQEYITYKLQILATPAPAGDIGKASLEDAIFAKLMSKKFRKYSVTTQYSEHIRNAIKKNVQHNQPLNLTFLGGAYKLWRLEEAPESDWAELFAHMYFINWVKPICEIYPPGVWFDFFLDDVIVPRINNLTENDVSTYLASRQGLIDFLKLYMPANMTMTLTGVGEQFPTRNTYEESLERNIKKLSESLPGGLPKLSDTQMATADLNVKVTPEQQEDPNWREKVELVHSAYMMTKGETGYSTQPEKIRVFTQPFPSGTCVAIGSTKDSVAKFWVGVGALLPRDNAFRQLVLSPGQLEKAEFDWEDTDIEGLEGKNFNRIRILK